MKKKLSLLLAVVLAMTMVMGIGVTAFADTVNQVTVNVSIITREDLENDFESVTCSFSSDKGALELLPGGFRIYLYDAEGAYMDYYCKYVGKDIDDSIDKDEIKYISAYFDLKIPESTGDVFSGSLEVTSNGTPSTNLGYYTGMTYDDGFWMNGDSEVIVYIGFPLQEDPGPNPPSPNPSGSSAPAHTHNFQWQTITEPTKDADGLEGEVCSCGATRNTQKLSAYGYALNQYATPMINAAKAGQTIIFELGEWNSFPKAFMEKLVSKSAQGVTFVFHYKWNHQKQEITIPAGTPIDLNFDYYGPAKMAELYGMY